MLTLQRFYELSRLDEIDSSLIYGPFQIDGDDGLFFLIGQAIWDVIVRDLTPAEEENTAAIFRHTFVEDPPVIWAENDPAAIYLRFENEQEATNLLLMNGR